MVDFEESDTKAILNERARTGTVKSSETIKK
jgi:hypothetical protein